MSRVISTESQEKAATEALLDAVAEAFDSDQPFDPEFLIEHNGYHVSARVLLQSVRLHEALEALCTPAQ